MILNNDREQQIAKKDPEKKISKNANLQIQMTWSGMTICKKKRSGTTIFKLADGHPIL